MQGRGVTPGGLLVIALVLAAGVALCVAALNRAEERHRTIRAENLLRKLATGIQSYVSRYAAFPPRWEMRDTHIDPEWGVEGPNYASSRSLCFWMSSRLRTLSCPPAGRRWTDSVRPLVQFDTSEISTWRGRSNDWLEEHGQDEGGRFVEPGFILDPWQRAIGYLEEPSLRTTGRRPADRPEPGMVGRILLWSRGPNGTSPLPSDGPLPLVPQGDSDDVVLSIPDLR